MPQQVITFSILSEKFDNHMDCSWYWTTIFIRVFIIWSGWCWKGVANTTCLSFSCVWTWIVLIILTHPFRDRMNLKWTCDLLVPQPLKTFAEIWWTLQASALILGLSLVTSCTTAIVSGKNLCESNGFSEVIILFFFDSQTKVCNTLNWESWNQRCEHLWIFLRYTDTRMCRLLFSSSSWW